MVSSLRSSWMDPIIEFLAEDYLPSESKEADRVSRIDACSSCLKTESYTEGHLEDPIYCVFIPLRLMIF